MDYLLSLVGFAVAAVATPGPNNLMVMASGANFGYVRTLPHILGIVFGYPFLLFVLGLGAGAAFEAVPVLDTLLTVLMLVYLAWLAWRIANAGEPGRGGGSGRPLSFLGAAAFQWVNPKGWALGLGAVTIYGAAGDGAIVQSGLIALIFAVIILPCISIWCLFGQGISGYLAEPKRRRLFNLTMAALLIVSVVPVLL
jgi:threonine/homoserine/homoserine lactone efflux protein